MRVQKTLSALAVVSLVASASAQEPAPASPHTTIAQLKTALKQRDDAAKLVAELTSQFKEQMKSLNKAFDELSGTPTPIVPVNDPLKAKIAAAFAADAGTSAAKKADAVTLSGIYSAAVDLKLADDQSFATVGALVTRVRSIGTGLAADRLPGVRKAIGEELTAVLKSPETPLTKELREAAAAAFARIEAALDEVSK